MKIFLTGGSGFIGMNIIELLGKKHEILAPTHAQLELTDDEAVKNFFDKNSFDVVIHSAVKAGHRNLKDCSNQLLNNLRMFFNIIRNDNKFKKMIFLSSGLGYDQRFYVPKMKEEYFGAHIPSDEGGFSKYVISRYIEKTDNIIELRPFGVFGKHEDYSIRFISNMICKAVFNLPLTIKQNRRFDYIYIDDLVNIIEHFLNNSGKHGTYNITPDKSIALVDLARKVLKISGKDLPIKIAEDSMGIEYSGDSSRLRHEIKRLKLTAIDDAVQKLYKWYEEKATMINRECLLFDK